jgi:uncharacterized paraquat-inducible protein A
MKSERYEPKTNIDNANESCHYCHNTSLQQVGNEKVCAHCGTRVYSTAGLNPIRISAANARVSISAR